MRKVGFILGLLFTLVLVGCAQTETGSTDLNDETEEDIYISEEKDEETYIEEEETDEPEPEPELNDEVTMEKYNQIKSGMSYEKVVEIIGFEGEELSQSDVAGFKTIMYQWVNDDGSNMNATFQNNKLQTKAQFGLK